VRRVEVVDPLAEGEGEARRPAPRATTLVRRTHALDQPPPRGSHRGRPYPGAGRRRERLPSSTPASRTAGRGPIRGGDRSAAGYKRSTVRRLSSLSVFYPCHNEAASLPDLVARTLAEIAPLTDRIEVIVVDDGSTDGTPDVVRRLAERDPRVRTVRHERCGGYGAALRSGFAAARHEWVFLTDGDAQFDVAEFPLLVGALDRADVAVGYRIDRKDNTVRRLNGFAWNVLVRLLFSLRVRDVDCAFKLIPAEVLRRMRLGAAGAVISTEFLVRAQRAGCRIAEVGVHHRPRVAGRATGGKISVIARAFAELFLLRLRLWREPDAGRQAARWEGSAAATPGHGPAAGD
jgi:glycosyl transferase family 2